ncbi:preprotein translocase subunit SecE [Saccharothrix sp. NRRL B-16348]|uniref:preprotein translocase subunit SecE n=1 Tax=Saccharothrix sp. NRRL B-16348 TaxID=1415542 RepID=UPI0006AF980B|nr:preprotein translocase subunit SecE [Saccharothrix sp. NRRL B-16348]KOX33772.1 preprotein translocase subunit SecE [Saccharothrix sp. NRRL B-16348]
MSEGREQDQPEEREGASRPVTAAARRERRGSARPAGRKDSVEAKKSAEADSDAEGTKKGRATRSRADSEKRVGFFARIVRYVREVVSELRKVIWPTRKQMITYTGVVLVFVAFMVALVFGLDSAFAWGMFRVFG